MLLQIGERGVVDSVDGSLDGKPRNSSRTGFFKPAGVVVDPESGDIYVADGYGNRRVAVFDRTGKFLRQWGRQATPQRVTMLRTGMSGVQGRRWRLKVSDPVYVAFLGATQDTQLRNH